MGAKTPGVELPGQQLCGSGVVLDDEHERPRGRVARLHGGGMDRRRRLLCDRVLGRQSQREHAAVARLAGHGHVPAVQQGEAPSQREAEAGALLPAARTGIDLVELAEDFRLLLL